MHTEHGLPRMECATMDFVNFSHCIATSSLCLVMRKKRAKKINSIEART